MKKPRKARNAPKAGFPTPGEFKISDLMDRSRRAVRFFSVFTTNRSSYTISHGEVRFTKIENGTLFIGFGFPLFRVELRPLHPDPDTALTLAFLAVQMALEERSLQQLRPIESLIEVQVTPDHLASMLLAASSIAAGSS